MGTVFARRPRGDEGMALVTVVGSMIVVTAMALAALAFSVQSLPASRRAQDRAAATAAAQAGIDDYISRLNVNPTYYSINGTGVDAGNPAFSAAGALLPGGAAAEARFRYSLVSKPAETAKDGFVRLRSTGQSRGVERTVTAKLTQNGFLRYLYFTDVEALDPKLWDTSVNLAAVNGSASYTDAASQEHRFLADKATVDAICASSYYDGRKYPSYTSSAAAPYIDVNTVTGSRISVTTAANVHFLCREIQFTGNDVINGPLHSNDALQVNGPVTFASPQTETSWLKPASSPSACGPCWWSTNGSTPAVNKPVYAPRAVLPTSNSKLIDYSHGAAGCYYTGQTRITFTGTTMKVLSPQTTAADTRCLDTASRDVEQTKSIPSIIYVDDATAACGSGVGYPRTDEVVVPGDRTNTAYNCQYGNAFLSGVVSGQVTIGTSRDVVVTNNLSYQTGTTGTDVVGLIPNGSVWVYNPIKADGSNLLSVGNSVHRIDAAILSLQHSFLVQNWAEGSSRSPGGTVGNELNVTGAITQKFRGPVGTGNGGSVSTGYAKNYVYDTRLRYLPPPFFLAPEGSPWTLVQTSDG